MRTRIDEREGITGCEKKNNEMKVQKKKLTKSKNETAEGVKEEGLVFWQQTGCQQAEVDCC